MIKLSDFIKTPINKIFSHKIGKQEKIFQNGNNFLTLSLCYTIQENEPLIEIKISNNTKTIFHIYRKNIDCLNIVDFTQKIINSLEWENSPLYDIHIATLNHKLIKSFKENYTLFIKRDEYYLWLDQNNQDLICPIELKVNNTRIKGQDFKNLFPKIYKSCLYFLTHTLFAQDHYIQKDKTHETWLILPQKTNKDIIKVS